MSTRDMLIAAAVIAVVYFVFFRNSEENGNGNGNGNGPGNEFAGGKPDSWPDYQVDPSKYPGAASSAGADTMDIPAVKSVRFR